MPLKGTKLPRVPVDSATLSNSSHAKTGQPAVQHGGAVSSAESSVVLDGQDGFGGADKGSEPEIRTSKHQRRPTAKARPSNTVIAQAKRKTSAKVPSPVALSSISQHSPTPVPDSRSLTAIRSPTLSATIPLVSFDASNKSALGIRPLSVTKWQTKKKGQHPAVNTLPATTTNKDRVSGANEDGDDGNQVDPPAHLEAWILAAAASSFLPTLA
ncbi:hypothetical protein BS47DRAFT_1395811 [Hydnum rufescens UP504]|uniref:Uncharacterized protein n=1 Tax=Hydnum rufescens UP504 TaxID=1448309 RepID=A0A9P6ARC0_9AGAM|nr:hypothetical protein BS47DRAFT_1395811 [Hydnum rufescens UP504]